MRMFKPTYYDLQADNLGWIFKMEEKSQGKAYKAWMKRLSKIDDACLLEFPHGGHYDQLNRIWVELYERCAAIRYPDMVNGVKWPEIEDEYLSIAPRGTFAMRIGGKAVAAHTGTDKFCINPRGLIFKPK